MICPRCSDAGNDIDMIHETGVRDFHDPGAADGHGQSETCGLTCPACGYEADCDRDHSTDDHE